MDYYEQCSLCPRKCHVNRHICTGFCGAGDMLKVARADLYFGEEPCISGKSGSGAIFFSGCNLKCEFCQNFRLSHENFGVEISSEKLARIMIDLRDKGALNINLVTGTMYIPGIIEALDKVKDKLGIPVVYNSSGYESADAIRLLNNYVDIYLTDIKYYDDRFAMNYSGTPDYFENTSEALMEMMNQKGKLNFYDNKKFDDESAILKSGVIIRHLIMPGLRKDSIKILDYLNEKYDNKNYILSLMSQYTPSYRALKHKEINRTVTTFEYDSVVNHAIKLGFDNTYIQGRDSQSEEYTPEFDFTGID